MSIIDLSILFKDGLRPKGKGDKTVISNGEFIAICLMSLGPTTTRDLKTLLGRWRSCDGPYEGNNAYFYGSRNGAGAMGPKGIKWCADSPDPKCYWWTMSKWEPLGKGAKKHIPMLVLTENGLRLASQGLGKIGKASAKGLIDLSENVGPSEIGSDPDKASVLDVIADGLAGKTEDDITPEI